MSRTNLASGRNDAARCCTHGYASYDRLKYAPRAAAAAAYAGPDADRASLSPLLPRAAAGRARGLDIGPPGIWRRLGLRRKTSVHGQIIDCSGVLTLVADERPTFWLMYYVCAALSLLAGALLGLLT